MPPPHTYTMLSISPCLPDATHHVHDQMSTEETPVRGLLETRVLQRKEKRKFSPGGAEESSSFPARREDHKECLRETCHSIQESVVSLWTTVW